MCNPSSASEFVGICPPGWSLSTQHKPLDAVSELGVSEASPNQHQFPPNRSGRRPVILRTVLENLKHLSDALDQERLSIASHYSSFQPVNVDGPVI